MTPEVTAKVQDDIEKLLKASFIRTARYIEWLSNIVPVIKKNGKLRVCIDYRKLNSATPKDKYPIYASVDLLVDSYAGHLIMSMMDGHLGYNQIFIAKEDIHKTSFRCQRHIGTIEWIQMPFRLKKYRGYLSKSHEYYFS